MRWGMVIGLLAAAALVAGAGRAECPARLELNGRRATPREARWLRVLAEQAIPQLGSYTADACDSRCAAEGCGGGCLAAVGTWWALKEGQLDAGHNPFRQSLCHRRTKACARLSCAEIAARKSKKPTRQPVDPSPCFRDTPLAGVDDVCPADPCLTLTPWQVGVAGVQVYNWSDAQVADLVAALGTTEDALLREVADFAKFKPGDPRYDRIVNSTGVLRRSWLVRHPLVGLVLVARDAGRECVDGARSWCFGTRWDQTRWYAPTQAAALATMGELEQYFAACAPTTTTTTTTTVTTTTLPGIPCADLFDCPANNVCCTGRCQPDPYAGQGVCSTLYTPACTLCRTDDDCRCNPQYPIFCDSCGDVASLSGCVNPCP